MFLHAYMGGCPSSNSGSGISKSCWKQDHSPWAILPGGMQEVPRTNWLIYHYFAYSWPTRVIVQPFAFVALLLSLLANWVVTAERPLLQVRRIVTLAWAPVKHLQTGKVYSESVKVCILILVTWCLAQGLLMRKVRFKITHEGSVAAEYCLFVTVVEALSRLKSHSLGLPLHTPGVDYNTTRRPCC